MGKCQYNNRKLLMILSAMVFAVFASLLVFSSDTYAASTNVYFDDIEEAGEYLIEQMVNRETEVLVYCSAEQGSASDIQEELYSIVNGHTDEGDEGDYLYVHHTDSAIHVDVYSNNCVYNGDTYYGYKCYVKGWRTTYEMETEVTKEVNSVYKSLKLGSTALSDYEKLVAIHDYICENTVYNLDAENCYTAYGVFCDGEAVCMGYAIAFYRLALEAGIDCYYINGSNNEGGLGHAWNAVKLDSTWYYVDVTWDDHLIIKYDYDNFLKGTATFEDSHSKYTINYNTSIAACVSSSDYKVDLRYASVTLLSTSYEYTGSAITPTVTVTINGTTLTKGTDYTVSYSDNTNAGTATVTVTGKGDYSGSNIVEFEITRAIDSATVTLKTTSYTYNGTAREPAVKSVVLDGTTLTSGTDYTVSYSDNTNAGTATVTITGTGDYSGTATATFTINQRSMTSSSAKVTLSQSSYEYDGTAKTPSVTVKYSSTTLTEGTDYTVSYSDNINAGTATVTVTGKGNYKGTKEKTFTIVGTSIEDATVNVRYNNTTYSSTATALSQLKCTYTGSAIEPEVTVIFDGTTLTEGEEYNVEYENNTDAGTATIIISGTKAYQGEITKTFTISAADISDAAITIGSSSYTYTGSSIKPTVAVKLNGTKLTKGTDYTVSYSNNKNVGTATITIAGYGGNITGSVTKNFTIVANIASADITLSQTYYVYTGEACTPTVTVTYDGEVLTKGTDYTVSYTDNINIGTAEVVVKGKGNYGGTTTVKYYISDEILDSGDIYLYVVGYDCGNGVIEPYDNESAYFVCNGLAVKATFYTIGSNELNSALRTEETHIGFNFSYYTSCLSGVSWGDKYAYATWYDLLTSGYTIYDVIASIPDSSYQCVMYWELD